MILQRKIVLGERPHDFGRETLEILAMILEILTEVLEVFSTIREVLTAILKENNIQERWWTKIYPLTA